MPDPGTATGTLSNPYPGATITSDFGPRPAPLPGASTFHSGIDYGVGIGTPTHALDGGRVIFAGNAGSAGNVVVIDHGNGAYSRYLHLNSIGVQVGDLVEANQVVAESGATGRGTGPHGHVELRVGGGATGAFRGGPGSTARAIDFEGLVGRDYTDVIVLQQGDTGSGVTRLQENLIEAGYGAQLGETGADGDYGGDTVRAVEAFQRAAGFTGADVDGRFGPATRGALDQALSRDQPAPTPPGPAPTPPVPAPSPSEPMNRPDETYRHPANGNQVNSAFGVIRSDGQPHRGVDYDAAHREALPAPVELRVVGVYGVNEAGGGGNGNNLVAVDAHGNAYRFLHFDEKPSWQPGDVIPQGGIVGLAGTTGRSTGTHLHLEVITSYDQALLENVPPTFRSQGNHIDPHAMIGQNPSDFAYLSVGARNEFVRQAQEQLVAGGFLQPESVTGYYGETTKAAVEALQQASGLTGGDVDGALGSQTIAAAQAQGLWPADGQTAPSTDPQPPTNPAPVDPAPQPTTGAVALDTPGAFAAMSSSDLLSTRQGEGEVAFSSLTLEQTRTVARAVFGDNASVEILSAVGAANGDERTFLQRVVTLARHEGAFSFGRENADPAAGFNVGTFQEGGGSVTSQAQSNRQFAGRVEDGATIAQRELGRELTAAELQNPAVRDVLAFVGWRESRSEGVLPDLQAFARANPGSNIAARMAPFAGTNFTGDSNQLFGIMADPNLTREQVIEGMSFLTQGGIRDIGESVYNWTTPGGNELYANMEVANARALEPDALRAEPAFPTLRNNDAGPAVADLQAALGRLGYDLGTSGPAGNGVDGDFGRRTLAAVQSLQREAGFTDTSGVVGPQTWGAISARDAREVPLEDQPNPEPNPEPVPPVGAPPVDAPPVSEAPLGDTAPEEYSVRQFGETIRDATWNESAARIGMSDDAARWVADTESPGDARVQLTFPGGYDRVSQGLTARPGSDVAAVLDAARQAENGIQVRTSEQNGSTGTYVLVDEAAILSRFPSVDAFVAAARTDLVIQDAVETELTDVTDAQTPAEARAVLDANPAVAGFLGGTLQTLETDLGRTLTADQAAGFTDTLYGLASNVGRQSEDGPFDVTLSEGLVRDEATRAGVTLDDAQVGNAVTAMQMVRTVAETNPESAEAVSTLRIEAAEGRSPTTDAPTQDVPAPERDAQSRTGANTPGSGTPGGDGVDRNVTSEPVLVTV